jgi:hypothetical protein
MSGPYGHSLLELQGPLLAWESKAVPVPAVSALAEAFHNQGVNTGLVQPVIRNEIGANGYETRDVLQLIPTNINSVGAPGGQGTLVYDNNKVSFRTGQQIGCVPKIGGTGVTLNSNTNYSLIFRGLFAKGAGPYGANFQPHGPLIAGETPQFDMPAAGTSLQIRNPTGLSPFLWTMYAQNIATDLGYAPGQILCCIPASGGGVVRGWTLSSDDQKKTFNVGVLNSGTTVVYVNASGVATAIDPTKWKFFIRFVALAENAPMGAEHNRRGAPLRLYQTPVVQVSDTTSLLRAFSLGGDLKFPIIIQPMMRCVIPELNYKPGDVIPIGMDDTTSSLGFSIGLYQGALHVARTSTLAIHDTVTGAYTVVTPANWDWYLLVVG